MFDNHERVFRHDTRIVSNYFRRQSGTVKREIGKENRQRQLAVMSTCVRVYGYYVSHNSKMDQVMVLFCV